MSKKKDIRRGLILSLGITAILSGVISCLIVKPNGLTDLLRFTGVWIIYFLVSWIILFFLILLLTNNDKNRGHIKQEGGRSQKFSNYTYQFASKIRTNLEGGYFIINENYVDLLFFMQDGNVCRAYKSREAFESKYSSFDEEIRKSILHNSDNLGKYKFDEEKNEIIITYMNSNDNRIMRCKLRETGELVVNYFYEDKVNKTNKKEVLEYQFGPELKYWLINMPSPNLGFKRFSFD